MKTVLRMTGKQHERIYDHLFPGDGCEAVAVLLCGRRSGETQHTLSVHEIMPIPYDDCSVRKADQITWPTNLILPLLDKAERKNMAIVKIHSHPGGYAQFSYIDDLSDKDLFPSVYSWADSDLPHASTVMLPGGEIFGRLVSETRSFTPLDLITVAGEDINLWFNQPESDLPEFAKRTAQAFGEGTTRLLRKLSIAVVGVSGTGSPTVEQLARYGVGKLVLVDPDVIEEKNLNRILNSTGMDALLTTPKVEVQARAVEAMGLGTEIVTFKEDLTNLEAVKAVAECDVVFGCLDSVDGRHLLNKIASFYCIPYFDIGVKLSADGKGGIDHIAGTVHYLQPDGSSLLSRGLYNMEQVRAEAIKRSNPAAYKDLLEEKYISGVNEGAPAVVSVNMFYSSLAVLEFLARLHPYRLDNNREFAVNCMSLTQGEFYQEADGEPCGVNTKYVGRGDLEPLLNMPVFSETLKD